MSKFTPGKWEVETHGISVFDERCEQTLFITDNVYSWADKDGEAEANARLIAAAPEMYRLLFKVLYHSDLDETDVWAVEEIEKLMARIDYGEEAEHE